MSNVLLHEVLLALLGFTGDVIEHRHSGAEVVGYRVSPSLSFIAPSERQRIDGIVQLGFLYQQLNSFILAHTHNPASLDSASPSPLYLAGLATALSTLLASYRNTVLHVERAILETEAYPLSSMQQTLQPFALLFPAIAHTIHRITAALHTHQQHVHYRQQYQQAQSESAADPVARSSLLSSDSAYVYHGGALLSLLESCSHTGYPLLAAAYRSLLATLHSTLYAQLESWCLYGELTDPCNEFFIGRRRKRADNEPHAEAATFSAVWERWEVRDKLLPSYIPHEVALKVLFIGRAVNILQMDATMSSKQPLTGAPVTPIFLTPPFLTFQSSVASLRVARIFSLAALDAALTSLHSHLAQQLSTLLFSQCDLLAHLRTLHSFYLLADGHFASFLLDSCSKLMSSPPSNHVDRDLTARFHSALTASNLATHQHSPLLSLSLDPPSFTIPAFPTPSPLSTQLVLCGDAAELAGAVRLTGRQGSASGGVWWADKRMVEYGWETRLAISVAGGSQSDENTCGFAFVMQNDKAVATVSAQWNRHAADSNQPQHGNMVNSLIVECIRRPSNIAAERREQISVFSVPYPPLASGAPTTATGRPHCLKAITGNWNLFDSHTHVLYVSYSSSDDETDGSLQISIGASSSPPLLSVAVRLSSAIQLEGGRANIGVVSATAPSTSTSTPSPPIYLHSWSFSERFPSLQPLLEWRNIRLSYKASGPLSLILRPASFERYLALFRFLFTIHRCHHALQHSFSLLSALKATWQPSRLTHHSSTSPASFHSRLLLLRTHLAHFVSCIHSHLHSDVLAPSLQQMMNALQVEKGLDFLLVRRAVDDYLVRCGVGCWVRDRVVRKGIEDVVGLAWRVMQRMEAEERRARAGGREEAHLRGMREEEADGTVWVTTAQAEFERLSSFLFTVWTRKSVLLSNQSLSQLLSRLDGNNFYTKQAIASGLRRLQADGVARQDSVLTADSSFIADSRRSSVVS